MTDFGMDMQMPGIIAVDWGFWQTLMDGDLLAYNSTYATNQNGST